MATYVAVFALVLAYFATVAAYFALRTLAKLRRDTHLLSRGTRGPKGQLSLIEVTTRHAELTAAVAEDVAALRGQVESSQQELRARTDTCLQECRTQVETAGHEVRAQLRAARQEVGAQLDAARQAVVSAAVDAARQAVATTAVDQAAADAGALRHVALVRYDAFAELSGRTSFSLALLDDGGNGVTVSAVTARADTRIYAKAVSAGEGEHELSPEERQAVSAAMGTRRRFRKAG